MVRDPDAKLEDLDMENESQEMSSPQKGSAAFQVGSIKPKGEDELRELKVLLLLLSISESTFQLVNVLYKKTKNKKKTGKAASRGEEARRGGAREGAGVRTEDKARNNRRGRRVRQNPRRRTESENDWGWCLPPFFSLPFVFGLTYY